MDIPRKTTAVADRVYLDLIPHVLFCPLSCFRVSRSKKLIQQVYRADKNSPMKCLKRMGYRCSILVPPVLPLTGLCDCNPSTGDGTYLVYRLPDLAPPNHVAYLGWREEELYCFASPRSIYDVQGGVSVSL